MCDKRYSSASNLQLYATLPKLVDVIAPCHFLKLPTELRQEIFKYLMPERPIDTLTVYRTNVKHRVGTSATEGLLRTMLPMSLLDLLLGFNREIYEEVRDVFYNIAIFTIDINRDGVTLCGRCIHRPEGKIGYNHQTVDQEAMDPFIRDFAWSAVKNYTVNVSIGHLWGYQPYVAGSSLMGYSSIGASDRDDEVTLYNLRDDITVIVTEFLAKARQLHNLQVSLRIDGSDTIPSGLVANTKFLISPFKRLRRVRNPRLLGLFRDEGPKYTYAHRPRGYNDTRNRCVTPPIPEPEPLLTTGVATFDVLAADWERCLALTTPSNIHLRSPMTKLFVEFKASYIKLLDIIPDIVRPGRYCLLHRARVAREQEDIVKFRAVAADLLACWHDRLRQQELERQEVATVLQRMFDADTFPARDESSNR